MTVVYLTQGTVSWTVPGDWNNSNNSIESIGAGGTGGNNVTCPGGGGGGGAYSKITNLSLTPGASITVQIGFGSSVAGTTGTDTWFNGASLGASSVGAKGGVGGGNGSGGAGGASASGVGTTKFSGGAGGGLCNYGGGGGGGAAGPNGAGKNGGGGATHAGAGGGGAGGGSSTNGANASGETGGNGGTAQDGTAGGGGGATNTSGTGGSHGSGGGGGGGGVATNGGAGGAGIEWDSTHGAGGGGGGAGSSGSAAGTSGAGGNYGGGGAGAGWANGSGAAGANGLIVISYTTSASALPWVRAAGGFWTPIAVPEDEPDWLPRKHPSIASVIAPTQAGVWHHGSSFWSAIADPELEPDWFPVKKPSVSTASSPSQPPEFSQDPIWWTIDTDDTEDWRPTRRFARPIQGGGTAFARPHIFEHPDEDGWFPFKRKLFSHSPPAPVKRKFLHTTQEDIEPWFPIRRLFSMGQVVHGQTTITAQSELLIDPSIPTSREFDGEDPLWVGFEVDVFDRQYPENANGTTTLRMSNRNNLTRVVGGMVRSYLPRLRTPIVIGTTLTIFSGSGTTSSDAVSMFQQPLRGRDNGGRVEWALGTDVTDPLLTNWMDPRRFRWLGTTFRLYEGLTFDPDNADVDRDLHLVYTGHVADLTFDLSATAPTAGIDTTDASSDLDRSLVDDIYATDYPIVALRGLPRPELHGRALSIAPVLEDQANLIYRVSRNALDDVTELRVGGVPWQRVFNVGPGPVVSYQITQIGGPGYLAYYMDAADIGWWLRNGATVTIGGALPTLGPGESLYTVVQPLGPSYIAALNAINYNWWIGAGATLTPFTGILPPPPPPMGVSPNLPQPIGTPSQGQWYADLVGGTVQLGSITGGAEVRVDAQAIGWATLDTAQLITDICTSKGVPVDPAYMAQLRIDWPGITSYYTTTTPVDALDALDTITLGNLCWWAFGPDGAVIAGFVKGPEQDPMSDFLLLGSSPAVPLDSTLLPTIPPLDSVPKELTTYTQQQVLPPAWRVRVEYLRRWAPEATFLGGLTENEASALRAPGQVWDWIYSPAGFTLTPADGLTIRLTEPRAQDIYIKSLALSDNDAQALRQQVVQNITGVVERNVLDVTAWLDSWQLRLFQNITLLWVDVSTDTQAIYGGTFRLTSAIRSLGGGPQQMELWGSATVISTTHLAPIPRTTAPLHISVVVQQLSPTATTGATVAFATLTDSAGNPFATGVTFTAPFGDAGGLLAINQIGPAYFAITLTGPLPTPGPFNGSIGAVDAGISVSVNFAFAANSVPSFPQTPPPPPTLSVVMTPSSPIVLPNTPLGAIVATLQGVWSNGAPFTGTFAFAAPNFNQGGIYEISGNWLIISPSGPGVSNVVPTAPIVTIVGIQT